MELALDLDNQVGGLFAANSYPTMILLGKTGKVEAVNAGNIADLESKMRQQLTDPLDGKTLPKPEPKAATAQQPPPRPATELVGKPAPDFSSKTIAGKDLGKADFANHPATILNFVAPNCGYCKKQVPILESIRKDYEAKGVRFVNMVEKMGAKEFTQQEIEDIFKGAGSQLEMALDTTNTVGGLYKATSYPTMFVVNKKGEVEQVHVGAKQDLDATLKAQLDAIIAGKPSSTAVVPGAPAIAAPPTAGAGAPVAPIEIKPVPVKPEDREKLKKE
jgi:thiol-disulfide isomerase/thioredoxin